MNGMLEAPISNFGVEGIRKAAKRALKWTEQMDKEALRWTLFNTHIFIDAEGGTDGGLFRYIFGRFLRQAAEITGADGLEESATAFYHIRDRWQEVAEIFKRGWKAPDPVAVLAETTAPLMELAGLEKAAWGRLTSSSRRRYQSCVPWFYAGWSLPRTALPLAGERCWCDRCSGSCR
ncbi:MAG: DUF4872 domain-containing protein [Anaerolineae bacterium]